MYSCKGVEKKQVSAYVSSDVVKRFDELFPHTRSIFVVRCIELAVKNKQVFDMIYFGDLRS